MACTLHVAAHSSRRAPFLLRGNEEKAAFFCVADGAAGYVLSIVAGTSKVSLAMRRHAQPDALPGGGKDTKIGAQHMFSELQSGYWWNVHADADWCVESRGYVQKAECPVAE